MIPPEPPECPNCGEYLPTDYLGRLDRKRCEQHVCNVYEPDPPPNPKHYVRFILYLSIMALLGVLLAKCVFGQMMPVDEKRTLDSEPHDILLIDHLHGHWLTVGRINHKEPGAEFNPNWTYIRTQSGIIPVIKKHGDSYQITFTSELTKDLP